MKIAVVNIISTIIIVANIICVIVDVGVVKIEIVVVWLIAS